jgi:urease beta subunit
MVMVVITGSSAIKTPVFNQFQNSLQIGHHYHIASIYIGIFTRKNPQSFSPAASSSV